MDSMALYNLVYRNMEFSKKKYTLLRTELVLIWQRKCLHMVFNVVKIFTFFSIVCPSYRMPSVAIGLALLHLILRFTSYNTNITLESRHTMLKYLSQNQSIFHILALLLYQIEWKFQDWNIETCIPMACIHKYTLSSYKWQT